MTARGRKGRRKERKPTAWAGEKCEKKIVNRLRKEISKWEVS